MRFNMKVTNVECFSVDLPPRRPHKWVGTTGPKTIGNYLIVKVSSDSDLVGYGEATVLPTWGGDYNAYYGETIEISRLVILDYLAPVVKAQDPFQIGTLLDKMDAVIAGYPYSKAALDMALFDLMGKTLGRPVYDLLGGCFRRNVQIGHSIGLMETEKAVEETRLAARDGIHTIKIKVGLDPDRDVDLVRKVRDAVGDKIELAIDANQGYATPKLAIDTIKRLESYHLIYAEQPVQGLDAMARVAAAVDTPVMADESVWSMHDALRAIRLRAADMISVYTTKAGGLYRALKIATVAEAAGVPCNVNGSSETGVGNAANLTLAASSKIIDQACIIPVTTVKGKEQTTVAGKDYLDDIVREPFKYEDGGLIVPDRPGLGFEIDEDKMRLYATG